MPIQFRKKIQTRWQKWLDHRLPRLKKVRLTQRNTFIFPAKEGVAFLFVVLLIFIGGINYENSLLLGTSFLLASLFTVSIIATYLNLSGLEVSSERALNAHVGELGFVTVLVHAHKPRRYGITLELEQFRDHFNLALGESRAIVVPFLLLKRGRAYPPRVMLESRYPLGLLRVWTWISLDQPAIAWPKPQRSEYLAQAGDEMGHLHLAKNQQQEEFAGLREYQPGDPLKHIHWKQLAKTGALTTKLLESTSSSRRVLTLESVPGPGTEARLSQLLWWAEHFCEQQIPFALQCPSVSIPMGSGGSHLDQVREALALYGGGL
ncbi:Hypothetical protein HDN1F_16370 [gamma proteobacterium HdN1]|nr:Hypothetical protein HDN1F_16370 [gamma proteobacterium HdN1]